MQHTGRVIVDPAGLLEEDAGFSDTIYENERYRGRAADEAYDYAPTVQTEMPVMGRDDTIDDRSLDDDDLLTLPATIPIYALSLKTWGLANVDHISSITWQEDAYDMLQMESTRKNMVRDVISTHHASTIGFDDFIPGKGRGLVFLLHGPPGCGKTLTAGRLVRLRTTSPLTLIKKVQQKAFTDHFTILVGPNSAQCVPWRTILSYF
jgi:hypothetical protein